MIYIKSSLLPQYDYMRKMGLYETIDFIVAGHIKPDIITLGPFPWRTNGHG